jgi:UDP-N-acetylglucosamine:LPS N-acetylglucosamine transferase
MTQTSAFIKQNWYKVNIKVPKKILYVSGSIGLGHVTRDLAIAGQLHKQYPDVELFWLASHPATIPLKEAGEKLLPEADEYADVNFSAENAASGFGMNILKYGNSVKKQFAQNIRVLKHITAKQQFDLVIGDETYELAVALAMKYILLQVPFVMIYDFLGLDSITKNPLEKLQASVSNRIWTWMDRRLFSIGKNLALFAGELEDVPDKELGFLLPNRRDHARKYYKFTSHILPFEPAEYKDRAWIREKLEYGEEPLVICSIGGTAIGKDLLELCGRAYPIIRQRVPDLHMTLICGPRIPVDSVKVPSGIEVKEYVPALYEHFAASDLAIVQGGSTATLELTALRRPFLYFPLENHCEQQVHVAERLARHQAGVKMVFSQTTPEILAEKVIANLGKSVSYPPIPMQGAQKAARLIGELL